MAHFIDSNSLPDIELPDESSSDGMLTGKHEERCARDRVSQEYANLAGGPGPEPHLVTSDVIHTLCRRMLQNAIENGTKNWDAVIMKTLSLVLQAVGCSRAGDIRRSSLYGGLYKGEEYLHWEDIAIRLVEVNGQSLYTATITMNYEKPHIDDPRHVRSVEITELTDPAMNSVCPIKLLLAHALRNELVPETSWQQLRTNAEARPYGEVVWTHPKRPVICAISTHMELMLDQPSPAQAAEDALQEAVMIAGLMTDVTSEDIDRGRASEIANICGPRLGGATEATRLVLGHSHVVGGTGIPEPHIGYIRHDTWKMRLEANGIMNERFKCNVTRCHRWFGTPAERDEHSETCKADSGSFSDFTCPY